jgi:hypothetical protein
LAKKVQMEYKMKFFLTLLVCLFLTSPVLGQEREGYEVRSIVQLKMIQAHRLNQQGNEVKAKQLINESIAIMLESIRNGQAQPWMREGLKIAMQSIRMPEEDINRIMNEVERYIPTEEKRPLTLREKLNSLTDTPAVKELARDRRRAALDGMFLGQKNGAVGYHPIISILPQGNSMKTGIVVSPDRRYVRISVSATDTSIGAVHTFNFSTGEAQSFNKR